MQYYGDGTLSVFKSAVDATECAIEIQKQMLQDEPVLLRIGLHMDDIVFDNSEVYGDGVNVASRIQNLSVAGSIFISVEAFLVFSKEYNNSKSKLAQLIKKSGFKS